MSWQVGLYVAAVIAPLAAFALAIALGRRLGERSASLATGAIALSFAFSLVGFLDYFLVEARGVFPPRGTVGPTEPLAWAASVTWASVGGHLGLDPLTIRLGVRVDNVTAILFLMVTGIATLVHIYSLASLRGDPRYDRYFAYLSLFSFAMLGLLAADNLLVVFVFWELVGICSYLLIGFWRTGSNLRAANKAFLVNRVGDVGLLVGMGLLWSALGTLDIEAINRTIRGPDGVLNVEAGRVLLHGAMAGQPSSISLGMLTLAGLAIFAACAGKSAQFPLHGWLPDAMAGPTPVSALIHAATMVAAGVYLVGRLFPIFTPTALLVIAYLGAVTLLLAATIAMVQTDYKKVLAYSTISQLGFMMVAMGVGGRAAGFFHLVTHAGFKSLLFLGSGSVYRAVKTYEMPVLGGLLARMPRTGWTMLAATLAISGVPLTSGFYSKDAILATSLHFVFEAGNWRHAPLFLAPVVGAALTAFYMLRMWLLVFGGTSRGFPEAGADPASLGNRDLHPAQHAVESPPLMTWPLLILAVPTIAIGWPATILPLPGFRPLLDRLFEYGEPIGSGDLGANHLLAMGASVLIATVGIGLGFLYYSPIARWKRLDAARTAARFHPLYRLFVRKWYVDEAYDRLVVRPILGLAAVVGRFDRGVIDRGVNEVGRGVVGLARLGGRFDARVVDGSVLGLARGLGRLGDLARATQTGRIRHYLLGLALAVIGLGAGLFAWVLR